MTHRTAPGKNRAVRNFRIRLPVGRQFARDDGVVASQKGKVTTGTGPIIGRIYSALAAHWDWTGPGGTRICDVEVEACECDSGQLRAMFLFARG
jgi:hypothetical protein